MMGDTTAIVATNAALLASKIISESIQDWNAVLTPEFITRTAFDRMIQNNTVINFHDHLRLARYAPTPILNAMCNCQGKGQVFVAMVPSGLGKTTAAKQFLHQFKEHRQGIAICVQSAATNTPYVRLMLTALRMSSTNPPTGWLKCLINCLHAAGHANAGNSYRKPFLILDDFGGTNEDAELIMALKSQVRNTNATVIVLTRAKETADYLLSQNNLQGIVPLTDTYPNFRELYPRGEWVSMSWDADTYKMSARHQPFLAQFSKSEINDAIDDFIRGLAQEKLDQLTPLLLWDELKYRLHREALCTTKPNAASSGGSQGNVDCTQCVVL